MNWLPLTIPADKGGALEALEGQGFSVRLLSGQAQVLGDAAAQAAAQAFVDGWDPAPAARQAALDLLEAERQARGALVLDPDPDKRFMALWHGLLLVAMPALFGQPLDAGEQAQAQQLLGLAQRGRAIEAAAASIADRIGSMTAAEAAAFDPGGAPEWPAAPGLSSRDVRAERPRRDPRRRRPE